MRNTTKRHTWYKVPQNANYTNKIKSDFLLFVRILVFVGILVLLFTGCSPYKRIVKRSPSSKSDTAAVLKVYNSFPKKITPPVIKPGKTILKKIPVEKLVVDEKRMKHLLDSITIINNEGDEQLVKDCEQSIIAERKKYFQKGYQHRISELAHITFEDKDPDTIQVSNPATSDSLLLREFELRDTQAELIKTTAERDIYKSRAKSLMWLVIALGIVSGVSLFFNVKNGFKSKIKL